MNLCSLHHVRVGGPRNGPEQATHEAMPMSQTMLEQLGAVIDRDCLGTLLRAWFRANEPAAADADVFMLGAYCGDSGSLLAQHEIHPMAKGADHVAR